MDGDKWADKLFKSRDYILGGIKDLFKGAKDFFVGIYNELILREKQGVTINEGDIDNITVRHVDDSLREKYRYDNEGKLVGNRHLTQALSKFVSSAQSRLRTYAPKALKRYLDMERTVITSSNKAAEVGKGFAKGLRYLTDADKRTLIRALAVGDNNLQTEVLYRIPNSVVRDAAKDSLVAMKKELEEIKRIAIERGIATENQFIDNYFPLILKDYQKFAMWLHTTKNKDSGFKSDLEKYISQEKKAAYDRAIVKAKKGLKKELDKRGEQIDEGHEYYRERLEDYIAANPLEGLLSDSDILDIAHRFLMDKGSTGGFLKHRKIAAGLWDDELAGMYGSPIVAYNAAIRRSYEAI
jgi:hypothetical protein